MYWSTLSRSSLRVLAGTILTHGGETRDPTLFPVERPVTGAETQCTLKLALRARCAGE